MFDTILENPRRLRNEYARSAEKIGHSASFEVSKGKTVRPKSRNKLCEEKGFKI